jgi:eukaryotic-like serine/threonine-protein kinase
MQRHARRSSTQAADDPGRAWRVLWLLTMNAQPGMLLGDSLRLDRHLSDGGMAVLWLAGRVDRGETVVVKFLSPTIMREPKAIERLRREAEIASRLVDPHIVRIYEFVEGPAPYLVMEWLDGEDLATRLATRGPLSLDETCEIVQQAASALASAHAVGVIHRDVKPENIFLTRSDGTLLVKLLDFGVATVDEDDAEASRLTEAGTTVGTPLYMSPEQLMDASTVDAQCDVWSLAVVAYACLTGRAPLEGRSFTSMCVALQRCEFEPPSHFRPDLPAPIDTFFARALHLRIEERPSSPTALSAELRALSRETCARARLDVETVETDEPVFPLVQSKRPSGESTASGLMWQNAAISGDRKLAGTRLAASAT